MSALRRLARQLETALAPGSAALNSIAQRMEAAEADLRSLQDTCRQLIVRTAASQMQQQHDQHRKQQQQELDEQMQLQNSVQHKASVELEVPTSDAVDAVAAGTSSSAADDDKSDAIVQLITKKSTKPKRFQHGYVLCVSTNFIRVTAIGERTPKRIAGNL